MPRVPTAEGDTAPNPLSALDRWKIADNLRRSLRAPALMALLLAGWLWLPGSPLAWTLVALASMAVPLLSGFVAGVMRGLQRPSLLQTGANLRLEAARWLLNVVFVPYEATIILDAIVTTLVRMFISHKRLLQWTTHAHTVRIFARQQQLATIWRQMNNGVYLTLALALIVALLRLSAVPVAAPLWLAWLLSPHVALWISRPIVYEPVVLSEDEQRRLRSLARRTWLFFEHYVGPEDHWLPPDHFQEQPRGLVAHRTSPTNIGLFFLSTLSAAELGYLGPVELVVRLRSTFEGMAQLERYRGHFLNWYETLGLKTLKPRYVSTVDSGNLAACLLVLAQGLDAWCSRPILSRQSWQGLCDTLQVLRETVAGLDAPRLEAADALQAHLDRLCSRIRAAASSADGDGPEAGHLARDWAALLGYLAGPGREELDRLLADLIEAGAGRFDAGHLRDLRLWVDRVHHHVTTMQNEVNLLLPWLAALDRLPEASREALARQDLDPELAALWGEVRDALPARVSLDDHPAVCKAGGSRLGALQEHLEAGPAGAEGAWQQLRDWCAGLCEDLESARLSAEGMVVGLEEVGRQARQYVREMEFGMVPYAVIPTRYLWVEN